MDTKWKNRLTVIAWLLLFTFGLSGSYSFLTNLDRFSRSYYETMQFHDQLNRYIDYLSMYKLDPVTEEEAKAALTVTEDEIADYPGEHPKDPVVREQSNMPWKESNVSQGKSNVTQEKSEQIREEIKAIILKNKKQQIEEYYQRRKRNRSEFTGLKSSFQYYLQDEETGAVYTDMEIPDNGSVDKYLENHEMAFIQRSLEALNRHQFTEQFPEGIAVLQKEMIEFTGLIAVPESLTANSEVGSEEQDYQKRRAAFFIYTIIAVLALVASFFILKRFPVFQFAENKQWEKYYNRVPADVCAAALLITGSIAYGSVLDYGFFYGYFSIFQAIEELIWDSFFVALTIVQGKFLFRRLKEDPDRWKSEWENSIVNKVFTGIGDVFLNRSTFTQMLILLVIMAASGFGIPVVMWEPAAIIVYVPLFLIITIPALIIAARRLGYFNRIVDNTRRLVLGNVEPDLPVRGKSSMAMLAKNVNTLKQGVETSQAEQAKSERFKTELITNVSHDLRTPLTSIITYTELLKTPELASDDREAYLEIIDRKSKRLKVLIEDLFEASKMASGSIDLVKEKVDINQLLQQALAENNEVIDESSLQFRVTKPESPVYCIVDGQKLWRVFDNLIGNILKYSMDHTRVFVSVKTERDQAVMTFKNITKYELSENIDELFERFKRGDTSRHTDGSGLGLAIAKSIVDLHGGQMDIEVDGDLFKVTVKLPVLQ